MNETTINLNQVTTLLRSVANLPGVTIQERTVLYEAMIVVTQINGRLDMAELQAKMPKEEPTDAPDESHE